MTKKRRAISSLISLLVVSAVIVIIYILVSKPAKAAWWNDSWTYRQKSTITNSGSAQTNFQVSITMDTSTPITAGKMQTDCDDIRLTDNTGNLLPIWLEPTTCNGASTKFWTKIPSIPVGTSTVYIYYGNSAATSVSNTETVFIQDIDQVQGAWTLDEASGTRADSSGNSYTLTDNATVGSTTGQYSNAARFVRTSSEYLSRADNANLSINNHSFTLAFWLRLTTISNNMSILSKQHNGGAGEYRMDFVTGSNVLNAYTFNSSDTLIGSVSSGSTLTSGVWYHIVFGYDQSLNKMFMSVDGATLTYGNQLSDIIPDSTDEFRLGQSNGGTFLDGDLDEVTFYKQAITDLERISDLKNTGYRGYFSTNYANHQLLQKYASTAPSSGTPATEEVSAGPMAHWKMDEGTDNTCSGGTNDTCNGTGVTALDGANTSVTWQTEDKCISGKCEFFNGSTSYVKINDSTAFRPTNITLSAWVRVNANSGDYDFISKQYSTSTNISYLLKLNSGVPQFSVCSTAASCATTSSAGTVLPTNRWFHLVGTYDGTTAKLYQDGQLIKQAAASITIGYDTNPIFLGARSIDGTVGTPDYAFVQGFLDDVKVFAYAQTATQVKADFTSRGSAKGTTAVLGKNKDNNSNALSQGLAGYWTLDEASGNATDYSGNGSTLTDTNTVTRVNGKFGNAGDFQNSDDLRVSDNTSLSMGNIDFTVSTWVNLDSKATSQPFIAKGASGSVLEYLLFYYVTSDNFRFAVQDSGGTTCVVNATSLGSPSTGTWYFVSAWHDSVNDTLNIQVNDGKVDTLPCTTGSFDGTNSFFLGNIGNNATFLDGRLDDVRVYKRILNNSDRLALYNWAPSPIGYWKIDENTGSSAYDSSGNSNTGTKTNGSWGNGKYGSGLLSAVNSTQERISAGDVAAFDFSNTQSFSFGMWTKRTNAGSIMMLSKGGGANNDDGYDIETSGGAASCYYTDGNASGADQATGTTSVLDGVWHHIFCVMDRAAGTYSVYVDGVKEGTDSSLTEGSAASNTSSFIIGEVDASSEIEGTLDEVKIYNYARTNKQIVEDLNGGHPAGGSPVGSQLSYWGLDEQQGQLANDRGYGDYDLTLGASSASSTDDPTWKTGSASACKVNGCQSFDGTADLDQVASALLTATDDYSISAWINPSDTTSVNIYGQGNSGTSTQAMRFGIDASSNLQFQLINDADVAIVLTSKSTITANIWSHVVVTKNGSDFRLYINGNLNGTATLSTSGSYTFDVSSVGALKRSSIIEYFTGSIDEVKVYNGALTTDEIKIDYNAGSATALGGVLGTQDNFGTGGNAPLVYWPFDENTGTSSTYDKSGNNNTGTLNSIVANNWVPGKFGSALTFDGSADYVSNADLTTSLTADLTIGLWFKTSAAPASQRRIADLAQAASLGLQISMTNTGTVGIDNTGGPTGSCFSSATYIDDKWHFVQVTRSSTTYTVYIDGGPAACTTGGTAPTYDDLYIATEHPSIGTSYFPGSVDEVTVYDYVRNAAQRAYDFNRGGPIGWWKFDECQGATAYDSAITVTTGNNGTITPGASTNTSVGTCGSGTSTEMWNDGTTGKINGSLGFDGSDDYVDMGDPSNGLLDFGTGDFSISLWVNPTAANGVLVTKGGNAGGTVGSRSGYYMYIESDRTVRVEVNSYDDNAKWNQIKTVNTIPLNSWSQLTYVKTSTEASFYINGVKQLVTSSSDPISQITTTSTAASFLVGTYFPLATYFNGQIDELRVYNYALSANQIKTIVNNGAVFFGPATGSP